MRKFLIPLLLASAAATPALAQRHDDSDTPHYSGERHGQNESRGERRQASEPSRPEPSNPAAEVHNQSNDGPRVRSFGGGGGPDAPTARIERDSSEPMRNWRRGGGQQGGNSGFDQTQTQDRGNRGGWQGRVVESPNTEEGNQPERGDRRDFWQRRTRVVSGGDGASIPTRPGGLVQPDRPLPRVLTGRTPVISDLPREGTQPRLRTDVRRTSHVRWNTDWRHNGRYDWRNWRRNHRSHFHLGIYVDPFGWDYRPYSIGWRLWPSYFSSRYWINDPWEYRLPLAPPGHRWIRYYDDLILVDMWDGQVVDVIYNFFW